MKHLVVLLFLFLSFDLHAQSQSRSCSMYVVRDKAYFYDQTISNGRPAYLKRKAYMVYGDAFTVPCRLVDQDWIYVVFRNTKGAVSKGYVRGSDVEIIGD
jgi:hypothetical protein